MSYYRVTESWELHYSHDESLDPNYNPVRQKGYNIAWSEEEFDLWHNYIKDLIKQKRYILHINEDGSKNYSQYIPSMTQTIYVIKKFKDLEGAQGYVDIMKSLGDPIVMKIEYVEE